MPSPGLLLTSDTNCKGSDLDRERREGVGEGKLGEEGGQEGEGQLLTYRFRLQ